MWSEEGRGAGRAVVERALLKERPEIYDVTCRVGATEFDEVRMLGDPRRVLIVAVSTVL
jgi:hypothetical protein